MPSIVGIHNAQAVGALSAEADVWSELEGRFNDVLAASQLLDLVGTGTDELIRSTIYFGELFGSLVIRKAGIARRLVKLRLVSWGIIDRILKGMVDFAALPMCDVV